MQINDLAKRLLGQSAKRKEGSSSIEDTSVIESFIADPDNSFLVSFPRTGSHWLRMIMELYFGRPSLVRIFYHHDRTNYLTFHTHDMDLAVERKHVIYLYRDPAETIFSQINYYNEPLNDENRISYWADLYGRHLNKWLIEERFTVKKTILSYEGMKQNLSGEFSKITAHFGEKLDVSCLNEIARRVTKEEVKEKTLHDRQVIQNKKNYEDLRNRFRVERRELILDIILRDRPLLMDFFKNTCT